MIRVSSVIGSKKKRAMCTAQSECRSYLYDQLGANPRPIVLDLDAFPALGAGCMLKVLTSRSDWFIALHARVVITLNVFGFMTVIGKRLCN